MAVMQVDPTQIITVPAKSSAELRIQNGNLKVCAYARVSTDEEEQLTSYHSQISHYTTKIKSESGWDFVKIFADEGISGTSTKNRKEFNKMIKMCRQGKIDLILTKSISRFARNALDSLQYARTLKQLGVGIVFEKENIDTRNMDNEMILIIMSAFAQAESESMSANISIGKRNGYKQGKYTFPNRMYGYEMVNGVPEIVENEGTAIRMMFEDYLKGSTLREIKEKLIELEIPTQYKKGWSVGTIRRILLNEKYKGQIILQKTYVSDVFSKTTKVNNGEFQKYIINNAHVPIVSEKIFDTVQAQMNRRNKSENDVKELTKTGAKGYSGKYALTGLVYCGCCGTESKRVTWSRKRNGKQTDKKVWKCKKRHAKASYCSDSYIISEETLHRILTEVISDRIKSFLNLGEILKTNLQVTIIGNEEQTALKQKIESLRNKLDYHVTLSSVKDASAEDRDTHFNEIKVIMDEITSSEKKLENIINQNENALVGENEIESMLQATQSLRESPTQYDDELVRELIKTVIINSNKTVDIIFFDGTEVKNISADGE